MFSNEDRIKIESISNFLGATILVVYRKANRGPVMLDFYGKFWHEVKKPIFYFVFKETSPRSTSSYLKKELTLIGLVLLQSMDRWCYLEVIWLYLDSAATVYKFQLSNRVGWDELAICQGTLSVAPVTHLKQMTEWKKRFFVLVVVDRSYARGD